MKLVLNGEALRPPITGVGNYTYHLLRQYLSGSYVDEVHSFSGTRWLSGAQQLELAAGLRCQPSGPGEAPAGGVVARLRGLAAKVPGAQRLYSHAMDRRFETGANALANAVYHETNYILKPFAGPCVVTIHDLSYVRYPEYHSQHLVDWLGDHLPVSLARADLVIAVSNIVRDEVLAQFGLPEHKVRTVYEGTEPCYRPRDAAQTADLLASLGLSHKRYILLSATLEPRKGIDLLLDAWLLLPAALQRAFPLILTGSSGWRNEALVERLAALARSGLVRHLGYVPADVLPVLFSGAAVFAYPSVYEGFGLPVLDAMSSGVPVICRAGTSMAEFSEGACVLCETGEPEELAMHLEMLLSDPAASDRWSRRGLEQAARFSWERCAAETAAVYRLLA